MVQGDATGGEQIGVAFVDVEARLDGALRQLREFEGDVDRSMQRISTSASAGAAGVHEVGEAAESTGPSLWNLIGLGTTFWSVWRRGIAGTIALFQTWIAAALAAARASSRLVAAGMALGPIALVLIGLAVAANTFNLALRGISTTIGAVVNAAALMGDALSGDAERARLAAREMADELERIPIIGGVVAGAMQRALGAITGDLDTAAEGAVRLRRGLESIPLFGRFIIRPIRQVRDMLTGAAREAEALVSQFERQRAQMRATQMLAERTQRTLAEGTRAQIQMARELELATLAGIDRINAAQRQRMEIEAEAHRERVNQLNTEERELADAIRQQQTAADLSRMLVDDNMRERVSMAAETTGVDVSDLLMGATPAEAIERIQDWFAAARHQLGAEHEQTIEHLAHLSRIAEDRAMADRAAQLDGLYSELAESRLRLEGRTFAAQAQAIRRNFATRIMAAERENQHEHAQVLREMRDVRIRQVQEDARAEAEARVAATREQGQRVADELRNIERDITREAIGDDSAMREAFDVQTEFADRIAAATDRLAELREEINEIERSGASPAERERLMLLTQQAEQLELMRERLGVLRQMRMEGIDAGMGDAGGIAGRLGREMGADRISVGEGLREPQEVEGRQLEEMLTQLAAIRDNTRPREVFG